MSHVEENQATILSNQEKMMKDLQLVMVNQTALKEITQNHAEILGNHNLIEKIIQNQATMMQNQEKLLENQNQILSNQQTLMSRK